MFNALINFIVSVLQIF